MISLEGSLSYKTMDEARLARLSAVDFEKRKLGTFDAYMVACETMWGVIIFLKFGDLINRGGLLVSLAICWTSAGVQVLNAFAVCAVATNDHHHTGAYNLLVANLGPTWGATTTLLYYLGMSSLATVEICGAVEAFDLMLKAQTGDWEKGLFPTEYSLGQRLESRSVVFDSMRTLTRRADVVLPCSAGTSTRACSARSASCCSRRCAASTRTSCISSAWSSSWSSVSPFSPLSSAPSGRTTMTHWKTSPPICTRGPCPRLLACAVL